MSDLVSRNWRNYRVVGGSVFVHPLEKICVKLDHSLNEFAVRNCKKKSVKPPCGCDDGMFDLPILRWQMKGQIPCSCSWSQYLLSDTLKESLRQFVGGVPLAAEMIPPFRLEIFHSTTSLSFAYQIIFLINPNKTPCAKKISHGFRDI